MPIPPPLTPQEDDLVPEDDIPEAILEDVKRESERVSKKRSKREVKRARKARLPKGTARARAAGALLLLVLLLGTLNALVLMWEGIQVEYPQDTLSESTGNVYGRVTDDLGRGIEGAEVTLVGSHFTAFTNEEGWYFIEGVPVDVYKVQVDKANFTSIIKKHRVEENMPRPLNFQLEAGTGAVAEDNVLPGQQVDLRQSYAWSVIMGVLASICAGVGGILALRRKGYRTTVAMAGIAIISYGFLLGSILAVVALVLVVSARRAFVSPDMYCKAMAKVEGGFEELPMDEETKREIAKADAATSGEGMPGHVLGIRSGKIKKGDPDEDTEAPGDRPLSSRSAEIEIRDNEDVATEPKEDEPIREAEVREELEDKVLESEDGVMDSGDEPPMRKGKKEIKTVGPNILPEMERALQDTLGSPEDTETDIISSVLKKLDMDGPTVPLKPPKKKKKKKRGLKAHQERGLCRYCVKPIIVSGNSVSCKCGRSYHTHCAKALKRCMSCGRNLSIEHR